jgi:hypothetical protein
MKLFHRLIATSLALAASAVMAQDIGVNIHSGGGSTGNDATIASIMATRNFKQARLDYFIGADTTLLRDQISRINANGGKAQLVVQNNYQWDYSCNQNLAAVESDSYNQTFQMVGATKDIAHDYEMLNEMQLRPDLSGQVAWNSQGTSTSAYNASSCAATLAAVSRGMARAIHDQGQRAILGEAGRDFGFLTYMKSQGVTWDVTGFHVYPRLQNDSLLSDPWYGTNGPIYQLSLFGKPITVNEFNCGEIYDSNYENTAGQPDTEECLQAVNKHLQELRGNTYGTLESVHVYELLDEPSNSPPENRFGLLYTLTSPKVELYLVTAYAGGTLTSTEQSQITSRGLLTDSQIAAMKSTSTSGTGTGSTGSTATESAQSTTIPSATQIVDAQGATWTVAGGVIYRNGVATVSSSVTLLLYYNHKVYQQNSWGDWWVWDNSVTSGNPWAASSDPRAGSADTTPPSVNTITAPGSVYHRTNFNVSATASDNVGVAKVTFTFNGTTCVANAAPYQCTFYSGGRGTKTLTVTAFDAANNSSSKSVSITVR